MTTPSEIESPISPIMKNPHYNEKANLSQGVDLFLNKADMDSNLKQCIIEASEDMQQKVNEASSDQRVLALLAA